MAQVYQNCKVYGPYIRITDGRETCVIVFPDKKRKTVSYPKYLMELKLDRYLTPDETVDHIDGDVANNNYDNLQVINRQDHCKMDVVRLKEQEFVCGVCQTPFVLSGRRLQDAYYNRKNKNATGPYCSKRCAGIASSNPLAYETHVINKVLVTFKSLMDESS